MEVKVDKTFRKDTKKIQDQVLLRKIADSITNVQQAENIKQIKGIKKLRGSSDSFSIKVGDYRLGVVLFESTVEFIRCIHRKDIYKFFPR